MTLEIHGASHDVVVIVIQIFVLIYEVIICIFAAITAFRSLLLFDNANNKKTQNTQQKNTKKNDSLSLLSSARLYNFYSVLLYLITNVFITIHETYASPMLIDHCVYFFLIASYSCTFIALRNVGIHYFLALLTNQSSFSLMSSSSSSVNRNRFQILINNDNDDADDDEKKEAPPKKEDGGNEMNNNAVVADTNYDGGDDDDDPAADDREKEARFESGTHLIFNACALFSLFYWIGYVVAVITNNNNFIIGSMSIGHFYLAVLAGIHAWMMNEMDLFVKVKYQSLLSSHSQSLSRRSQSESSAHPQSPMLSPTQMTACIRKWLLFDIFCCVILFSEGIIFALFMKERTTFAFPELHPFFLVLIFVFFAWMQGMFCRYLWIAN